MSDEHIPFMPGDILLDSARPGRPGRYTGEHSKFGNHLMLKIQYADGEVTHRPLDELELQSARSVETIESRIENGRFGQAQDLRRLVTFEKLKGTLHDVIYSMEAAQIDFYPYQFKPVMKFIASPTQRMLLADEVGLGKTIESALIWLELQARRQAKRLLVICPNILADKWRRELREKFQLDAQVVNFQGLETAIADLVDEGPGYPFVLIGTYTGLRPPRSELELLKQRPGEGDDAGSPKTRLLQSLKYWGQTYAPFDLVVFDEAHYMRNTATTTNKLGDSLASAADAVLCVSATPVNNKSRDLWSLLRLVDEAFFERQSFFDELMLANRPAVQLMNALSRIPVNLASVRSCLEELESSPFVKDLPLFRRLKTTVGDMREIGPRALAECQEMAERINLIGAYLNRTRRVQVAESRPLRDVKVIPVDYDENERALYDAVLAMVRRKCAIQNKNIHIFSIMGMQLRAASCLPAFASEAREGLALDDEELLYELGAADLDDEGAAPDQMTDVQELQAILQHDYEATDSKYEQLRRFITGELGDQKVVLFAFYRRTLAYLGRRFREDGIDYAMIHGGIPSEDRWPELDRFQDQSGPRVLLTSEVGSEGIDLQFCSVLINYDLPWNPMRVEQRIGRIDRVNQAAPKITIVNFKMKDTIEERLYERLYDKLQVFAYSLGDLEEVVGQEIRDLTRDIFSKELTPEEESYRIAQTERVLEERAQLIQKLEDSGETLMALSDYVQRKIEEDRGRGRFVQPLELRDYLVDFFSEHHRGTEILHETPAPGCLTVKLSGTAWQSLQTFMADDRSLMARPFRQREFAITFDHQIHKELTSADRKRVHYCSHISPLIRWVTSELAEGGSKPYNVSAMTWESDRIPAGLYCYRLEHWGFGGITGRENLAYGVMNLDTGEALEARTAESVINELLRGGVSWSRVPVDGRQAAEGYRELEKVMGQRYGRELERYEEENQTALQLKKEQVSAFYARRLAQDSQRVQTMRERGRLESVIHMTMSKIRDEEANRDRKLRDLDLKAQLNIHVDPIAGGLFQVVHGPMHT